MTRATKKTEAASTEKKSSSRAITPKRSQSNKKQAESVAKHGVMTASEKLDAFGIEAICDMIKADNSLASIAEKIGVSDSTIGRWIAEDAGRSARTREARIESAAACDRLALNALIEIPDDGTNAQVARQREIASHYRWRAKTRNPKDYGDTVKVDAEIITLTPEQVAARLAVLMAKNGAQ